MKGSRKSNFGDNGDNLYEDIGNGLCEYRLLSSPPFTSTISTNDFTVFAPLLTHYNFCCRFLNEILGSMSQYEKGPRIYLTTTVKN